MAFSTHWRRHCRSSTGALFNPYSFWGIVWVHTSAGGIWFKVILLMPVFRRLGAALEEAARVAGANTATMLWRITIPLLSPMILAVSVLSFIRGLQSFNTELLLGTPAGIYVYSTRIYDYIHREPSSYGEATALGSVFLSVSARCCFSTGAFFAAIGNLPWSPGQGYSTLRVKLGKWRWVALAGCLFYIAVMTRAAVDISHHRLVHAPLRFFQHHLAVYSGALARTSQPIRFFSCR